MNNYKYFLETIPSHTRSEIYLAIKELEDLLDQLVENTDELGIDLLLGTIERLRNLIV